MVTACAQPHAGLGRATGGLLSVAGAEARHAHTACQRVTIGPVAAAMADLAHAYVATRGNVVPVEVAERHCGVAGPAWLLPVAITRPDVPSLVAETLELAIAAGVGRDFLGHCVAYVELVACVFAGWDLADAFAVVTAATGDPLPSLDGPPVMAGDAVPDALAAGVWALAQRANAAEIVDKLATDTTPSVAAAAAGLLGLRLGVDRLPADWRTRLRDQVECEALAPSLLRARFLSGAEQDGGWTRQPRVRLLSRSRLRSSGSRGGALASNGEPPGVVERVTDGLMGGRGWRDLVRARPGPQRGARADHLGLGQSLPAIQPWVRRQATGSGCSGIVVCQRAGAGLAGGGTTIGPIRRASSWVLARRPAESTTGSRWYVAADPTTAGSRPSSPGGGVIR
jgi:hypothetical protein